MIFKPVQRRLDGGVGLTFGSPLECAPPVRQSGVQAAVMFGCVKKIKSELTPIHGVDPGEDVDAVVPHPFALLRRQVQHPTRGCERGSSAGTRPSMRSITRNGAPKTAGSSSWK